MHVGCWVVAIHRTKTRPQGTAAKIVGSIRTTIASHITLKERLDMRELVSALFTLVLLAGTKAAVAAGVDAPRRLFIGNSFTFAQGSAVRCFHASRVTDLNGTGLGGVPALFSVFAAEAGLDYNVFLETEPGSGREYHLASGRLVDDKPKPCAALLP